MPVRPSCLPVRPTAVRALFRMTLAMTMVAASLLAGSGLPAARGDIQEPIEAHNPGQRLQRRGQIRELTPADATPQAVQIHQGESVEIVLRAHGQVGKTIEFLIRSWPTHGTLDGLPRNLTHDTATITYTHRVEDGPGDDQFTYAVKSLGTAVSAAVPVTVTVLDVPPSLAVTPAELDFGTVKAGDSTRATITLENRGGGVASGIVEPPPPWTVDGVAAYHLGRGQTQTFQIVFQPSYGRSYVESAHFHAEEGRGVRLIGTGIGPRDPAEDVADRAAAGPSVAETIARDNALAMAAGNAARPPSAAAALAAARAAAAAAQASRTGRTDSGGVISADSLSSSSLADATNPARKSSAGSGPTANGTLNLPVGGADSVEINEAAVKAIEPGSVGANSLDLAWTPPRPTPRSYRIELRYLSIDSDEKLRVDWRPYAKVEIRPTLDRVTAHVNGLPEGTRQYVRVVAVDDAGRLAVPSPTLMFETRAASTWFHLTFLKVLIGSLLLCLGTILYRKWEEQQILREIDDRRAARNAELLYKP